VLGQNRGAPGNSPEGEAADSAELLKQAREAQRAFERMHRRHLPRASGLWEGGCDERLGSMCLRFDGSIGWEPSPEDSAVSRRRDELLATLQRVGEVIPGDRWVLGQRIRYLVDLGRWNAALALSRSCQGPPEWWCSGLQGYVLHRSGQILEAGEAFGRALDLMDPSQALEWTDPSLLLEYRATQWLKDPPGLSPETAVRRFWGLADPLFLTPGNERLTEHFSRHFASTLLRESELTLGVSWGRNMESILVRYGFGVGWERALPRMQDLASGSVVEHHHPEARGLLPPVEALLDPSGLPERVWTPVDHRPRSASAPVLASLLVEGQAETAVFRREGELLVVVSYEVPADTLLQERRGMCEGCSRAEGKYLFGEPSLEESSSDTLAGLFLVPDTGAWAPLGALSSGARGILKLQAPPGRYLLSAEVWNPAGRWGARVRRGIAAEVVPPDVPALSDLILLDPGPTLPAALEEALPRMRSTPHLGGDEKITVGWEVYGLGFRREEITFRLRVIHEEESLVRRALKRIGLFRREPVLTLSWSEGGPENPGPFFRAVDLDLPIMDPGRYVLQLEMNLPGRTEVLAQRRISVQ